MTAEPSPRSSVASQHNRKVSALAGDRNERTKKMNYSLENQPEVPCLEMVRSSVSSRITQIVEFFLNGKYHCAHVDEIVDGIQIENRAERESVYSTMDPYTDSAAKRDNCKPLIFHRVSPGQYEFLGFEGDPLDLTKKLRFRSDLVREAYNVFSGLICKSGKAAEFKKKSTSERVRIFHANLHKQPRLLKIADDNLCSRQKFSKAILQLKL